MTQTGRLKERPESTATVDDTPMSLRAAGAVEPSPRRHVLDLDDFSTDEIMAVLQDADAMMGVLGRDIKKAPTLRGKTVITLFYEPSTRTRVSFEQAGKILSADVINVSGHRKQRREG